MKTGLVNKTLAQSLSVIDLDFVDSNLLASIFSDGTINTWNLTTNLISFTSLSNAGSLLITSGFAIVGSLTGIINFYNLGNPSVLVKSISGTSRVNSLVVLPNGYLVSGLANGTMNIYNWATTPPTLIRSITGNSEIFSLASFPNNYLASGFNNGTINIWNMNTGLIYKVIQGNSIVYSLAPLPNSYLACGFNNGSINILLI